MEKEHKKALKKEPFYTTYRRQGGFSGTVSADDRWSRKRKDRRK